MIDPKAQRKSVSTTLYISRPSIISEKERSITLDGGFTLSRQISIMSWEISLK